MELTALIGKSLWEVVPHLNDFDWRLRVGMALLPNIAIDTLHFTYYVEDKEPDKLETFLQGYNSIKFNDFDISALKSNEEIGGLMSIVRTIHKGDIYSSGLAHIPMLDFDTDEHFGYMSEDEIIDMLVERIEKHTQLKKGLILKSGPKKNYFFMGIGELLADECYVTFLGLALTMKHPDAKGRDRSLVDTRFVGHSLTTMKYDADELAEDVGPYPPPFGQLQQIADVGSRYGHGLISSTLRLDRKRGYEKPPAVVKVFDRTEE